MCHDPPIQCRRQTAEILHRFVDMAEQTMTDSFTRTIIHFPVMPQLNQCIRVHKIGLGKLCHDPAFQCKTQNAEPFSCLGVAAEHTLTDSFLTIVYGIYIHFPVVPQLNHIIRVHKANPKNCVTTSLYNAEDRLPKCCTVLEI